MTTQWLNPGLDPVLALSDWTLRHGASRRWWTARCRVWLSGGLARAFDLPSDGGAWRAPDAGKIVDALGRRALGRDVPVRTWAPARRREGSHRLGVAVEERLVLGIEAWLAANRVRATVIAPWWAAEIDRVAQRERVLQQAVFVARDCDSLTVVGANGKCVQWARTIGPVTEDTEADRALQRLRQTVESDWSRTIMLRLEPAVVSTAGPTALAMPFAAKVGP